MKIWLRVLVNDILKCESSVGYELPGLSRSERRLWANLMLGECFDPQSEVLIAEHCRPHWSQAGAVVFITFRTHDSIPREVLLRWDRQKQEWLRRHGHDSLASWKEIVPDLSVEERAAF